MVEDHSPVTVRVSAAGIAATDRLTGAGLRWITPGMATVSGTVAQVAMGGVTWNFAPTGSGLSFSAIVSAPQGPKTYLFAYRLLGGTKPLSVDARGQLVAGGVTVTRASVVTADGKAMPAGAWSLLAGGIAAFSFNDTSLKANQFPYVIDPATQIGFHTNFGQSYLVSGPGYPPLGGTTTYDGTNWLLAADDANGGGQYAVSDFALSWDTSAVPPTAVGTGGWAALGLCAVTQGDPNMALYADWVDQGFGPGLYPPSSAAPNALGGAGDAIPVGHNAPDVSACLAGTGYDDGNYFLGTLAGNLNMLPLNTGSGFSPSGVTMLRVHIANRPTWPSSPAPATYNYVYFTGYNNAANQPPPTLFITYILPVNPPSLVLPNPTSFHTLTPGLQVTTTDPDGDAVNWYGYFITDSQGTNLWNTWVNSTAPQNVPAGVMAWNQTYTLTGCGWDGVDPYAVYPNGGVTCSSWPVTPANQAPPTPAQLSPPPGALVTATSSTTLSASAVTDPDGDPVSYDFEVFTNPAGTGTPLSDSGAIAATSWTTPGLSDGTYYWRVQALDNTGDPSGASAWSATSQFLIDTTPPPVPAAVSPLTGNPLTSTSPAFVVDPVASPGGFIPVSYWYRIATGPDGLTGDLVDSGWVTSTSWTPPAGSLQDGQSYAWVVRSEDSNGQASAWSAPLPFSIDLRLGAKASYAQDGLGPVSVNLSTGNAMAAYASPPIDTLGGNLGVSFAYNSAAPGAYGLAGSYYVDTSQTSSFGSYPPAFTRTDPQVNFNWSGPGAAVAPGPGMPANWYLASWSGLLELPASDAAGAYSFGTISHDGVTVTVNGTPVVNRWFDQASTPTPVWGGSVNLTPGVAVAITVKYYDAATPGGQLSLWIQGPGQQPVVIPSSWFPAPAAALPDGWALSAGTSLAYASAVISPGRVVLADPSGATHVYIANGSGGFSPLPGEDAVLALDANGALSVQGEDANTYVFDAAGVLTHVFSATDDTHPAAASYAYAPVVAGGPLRLTSVTDPVTGRAIVLSYGGQAGVICPTASGFDPSAATGILCRIDYSAFGRGVTNLYYSNGHLARIEDPGAAGDTPVADYGYDSSGRLISLRDVLNNDLIRSGAIADATSASHLTQVGYDPLGRASTLTAPVPDTASSPRPAHTYAYPSSTTTKLSIAGAGVAVSRAITVDPLGNVASDTDGAGDKTTYTWQGSLLTSAIDPTGVETTTLYDAAQRPTDAYGPAPASSFSGFSSSSAPHATTAYDQNIAGLAATYFDDPTLSYGAPTMTVHATGVGDPSGALDATWGTTPPAGVTTPAWSARFTGEIKLPASGGWSFALAAGGASASLYLNDVAYTGGPVSLNAGPQRIRVDYATTGGPASVSLSWTPPGGTQALVPGSDLDPRYGLVTSKVDADAKLTATQYSGAGVGPEEGLPTAQIVDPGGLSLTTTTNYEPKGTGYFRRVSSALPAGVSTTLRDAYYGAMGTSAASNCTSGGVVQAGLLASETGAGPNPVVHDFAYDASGRVVATQVVGDPAWSCTAYDARGRVSTSSDSSGKTTSYDYSNPAVLTTTYTDSSGAAKSTASQVDFDGREVAYTDELANTTTRSYDQASRVTATARGSTPISTVSYDAASRVASLTDNVAGGAFGFSYDASGRITSLSRPNGVTTTTGYDPHGWVSAIINTATSGALPAAANSSYTYSAARRITSQVSQAQASSFAYDAAGRLSSQVVAGVPITYAYDADSNRCATDATTCASPTYTYDAADRITTSPGVSSYAYNYRGDVTSMGAAGVAYDANDHATSTNDGASPVATVVTTEVGPTGRVLQRSTSPGTDTLFGFGSSSDSPAYSDPALLGVGTGPITTYVNGPGGLLATDAGAVATYPLTNAHGDIVGTTDVAGTFTPTPATDAFGVTTGPAPASGLGYLGNAERFTTGGALDLISMGVRLYDPALGRFLQPDPVAGGSANAYDYCYQDPINCFDLAGTWSFRGVLHIAANVTGYLASVVQIVAPFCSVVFGIGVAACEGLAKGLEATSVVANLGTAILDCRKGKSDCESDVFATVSSILSFAGGAALEKIFAEFPGAPEGNISGKALNGIAGLATDITESIVAHASGERR